MNIKKSLLLYIGIILLVGGYFLSANTKKNNCFLSVRKYKTDPFNIWKCGYTGEAGDGKEIKYFGRLIGIWKRGNQFFLKLNTGDRVMNYFIGFENTTGLLYYKLRPDGYKDDMNENKEASRLMLLDDKTINDFLKSNKNKYILMFSDNPAYFDLLSEKYKNYDINKLSDTQKKYLEHKNDFLVSCKDYLHDYYDEVNHGSRLGNLWYDLNILVGNKGIKCLPSSTNAWVFN